MECAFYGSGYNRVLTDAIYDGFNEQMHKVVYYQLKVANIGVTVRHFSKQYEDDKDGYASWNTLCGWYDRYYVNNETAYPLRFKV